jgi:hypothetical protein
MKRRFFGYERDLPSAAASQILGGHVVFSEVRKGQRIAVIEMPREEIFSAQARERQSQLHAPAGSSSFHW